MGDALYLFSTQGISPSLIVFLRTDEKIQIVREGCAELRVEVISFSWCSRGLLLIERNPKKLILSKLKT